MSEVVQVPKELLERVHRLLWAIGGSLYQSEATSAKALADELAPYTWAQWLRERARDGA